MSETALIIQLTKLTQSGRTLDNNEVGIVRQERADGTSVAPRYDGSDAAKGVERNDGFPTDDELISNAKRLRTYEKRDMAEIAAGVRGM